MYLLIKGLNQVLTLKGKNFPRAGKEASDIGLIEKGAILIKGDKILKVGREKEILKKNLIKKTKVIDVDGVALPSFVDSHTHAIFAQPRLKDFSLRTKGLTYQQIKERGGGIFSSVKAVRKAREKKLVDNLLYFCQKFIENGTGTIEVKSGYGLDLKNEIKLLESIKEASVRTPLELIPTFLGAHSIPPEFKNSKEYLDYLAEKILPEVVNKKLAVFADIFCEKDYFGHEESALYLKKCKEYGLIPKIHAEQMGKSGGSIAAYKVRAISADHMDYADGEYLDFVKKAGTIVTFLPASNYFLGLSHYPDVRILVEKNIPFALATDFNPGTSPCLNMQFVISCAVTHMKMSVEQALCAATINGACALNLQNIVGSIEQGKQADISIFEVTDYRELAYYFGSNLNKMTIKKGKVVYAKKDCTF